MNDFPWDEIDNIKDEMDSLYSESTAVYPSQTPVKFTKNFGSYAKRGTKAIVVDRDGDYYAVSVKGNYVEGVHASFLKEIV